MIHSVNHLKQFIEDGMTMKKYAIGLCGLDEDIEVVIIEAPNELVAMCDAVANKFEWEVREDGELPFITTDETIDYFLQGDVSISRSVEI